jgi:hypothetical protein
MNQNLYVIIPYYNYFNNTYREKNLLNFIDLYSKIENCKILVVEGVTETSTNLPDISNLIYKHIKYNIPQAIWVKENLINLAVKNHLPKDWNYMSWMDGDIYFFEKEWVNNSIELLKKYDIIQMFDFSLNQVRSDNKSVVTFDVGYINAFINSENLFINDFSLKHAGYGWAINKQFYEKIGGLWELNIIGSADTIIARSTTQHLNNDEIFLEEKLNIIYSQKYGEELCEYYKKFKNCNFSFLKSKIYHFYHSHLSRRLYVERHEIPKYHLFNSSMVDYSQDGVIYTNEKYLAENIQSYIEYKEKD